MMNAPRAWFSPCTDKDHSHRNRPLPDWAHWLIFTGVSWSRLPDFLPGPEQVVDFVERLPEVGSLPWIKVTDNFSLPRDGGSVWALFTPPLTELNGWDGDHPEEIGLSGFVRVELVELVSRPPPVAWLRVRVLEVRAFTELFDLWPPCPDPAPLPGPPQSELLYEAERHRVLWQDLALCWSCGDDELTWVLCQRRAGRWHLLVHADWWFLCDAGCVGHRLLNDDEAAYIGLPDAAG